MTRNILVIPDTHFPLVDKRLWKSIIEIVQLHRPDEIIHIGDLMDYPQPSRWTKGTRHEFEGSVFEDSEKAIRQLLEPLREAYDGPIGVIEGNHDCLDTKTRAVTSQGLKNIDELTGEELVLSVDQNGNSIWQRIDKIVRYPHKGKMYRVKGASVSALITRNHRIVGLDKKKESWVETTPETMTTDRLYSYSAGRGKGVDNPHYSDEIIRLAAWCVTDSFYDGRYNEWILYQSGINAETARKLLQDNGLEFKEKARERDTEFIAGKKLKSAPQTSYEFKFSSDKITKLVPDKNQIPEWIWGLSERQFQVFLDELIFCDGSDYGRGTSKVLYVCREKMREDLMVLCAMNGVRANAYEYRPGHWRLNISKQTMVGIYRDNIEEEDYSGEVWCLQVPNGRFFIERDGKLHLTGNCRPRAYLEKYAPALAETGAFDFDKLLRFDELEITKLPDFYKFAPGWIATHGHLANIRLTQNAGNTALNAAKKLGTSLVMGHTHRAGISSYTTGYQGNTSTVTGVEVGHIMDPKKVTYLKGGTGNWQTSLAWLTVEKKHVTPNLLQVSDSRISIGTEVLKV